MLLTLLFFYEQMKEPKLTYLYNDYRFWIILGMLTYLTSSFFIYMYASTISPKELYKMNIWFLTYVFYSFKSIFTCIGILVLISQPKPKEPRNKAIPFLDIT